MFGNETLRAEFEAQVRADVPHLVDEVELMNNGRFLVSLVNSPSTDEKQNYLPDNYKGVDIWYQDVQKPCI